MTFSGIFTSVCLLFLFTKTIFGHGGEEHLGELSFTCKTGWDVYNGNCYLAVNVELGNMDAKLTCLRQGGHLVYLDNELELPYLIGKVPFKRFWNSLYQSLSGKWFLMDDSDEVSLKDLPGWASNMPDETKGNCGAVDSGALVIEECSKKLPFVCKYRACLQGLVPCATGGKCVNATRDICDGINNCDDKSDERDCASKCTHYTQLSAESGTLQTGTIDVGTQCTWLLEAPIGKRIRLTVPDMSLDVAYVEVWTGSPSQLESRRLTELTGSIDRQYLFSDNNFLTVRVFADNLAAQLQSKTFSWTTDIPDISDKAKLLTATTSTQRLTFPFAADGPADLALFWSINAQAGQVITFYVESNKNLMNGEVIPIQYADGDMDTLYHSFSLMEYVVSRTNVVHITMQSSQNVGQFTVKYRTGCRMEINVPYGTIMSPGYRASSYSSSLSCEWILTSGMIRNRGMSLKVIDMQLAVDERDGDGVTSSKDLLQVFIDNSTEPGVNILQYVEGDEGTIIHAPGGKITVKFTSDVALTARGFKAMFGTDCLPLALSQNTVLTSQMAFFEESVTLTCRTGYVFDQERYKSAKSVTMECHDLKWHHPVNQTDSGAAPKCQIVYCGTPDPVSNGYIVSANGSTYNSVAKYDCNDGFTMNGSPDVTCDSNGDWVILPTCTSSYCEALFTSLVSDGSLKVIAGNEFNNNQSEFGTVVQFDCNPGYQILGPVISHCADGEWTHTTEGGTPVCHKLKCPQLSIRNAEPSTLEPVEFDESLQVNCLFGYRLRDSSDTSVDLRCQSNQTFDRNVECIEIDECTEDKDNCNDQSTNCENLPGSFKCTCKPGYKASTASSCQDIDECAVDKGGCHHTCNNSPGSYSCSCDLGFDLYNEDGLHGYFIPTTETGSMRGDVYRFNHTCVRKSCPTLGTVTNGRYLWSDLTSFHSQDTVTLQCMDGYYITGGLQTQTSDESSCNNDGNWENLKTCSARTCNVPSTPSNGNYDKTTTVSFGEILTLACQYTQTRNVTKTARCIYEESSVRLGGDKITSCPEIDCGVPVLPNGGQGSPDSTKHLNPGSEFPFSCDVGYDRTGASNDPGNNVTVKCKENGRWDLGTLGCVGKRCTDPGTPGDAIQWATSYERGQVLYYSCTRNGFKSGGSDTNYTCQYDSGSGEAFWSPSLDTNNLPACIDVEPPTFPTCPTGSLYFDAMDTYSLPPVQPRDNFLIKTSSKSSYIKAEDVILSDSVITYTADDFEDSQGSCTVMIKVIDRATKPTLVCPDMKEISVDIRDEQTHNVSTFIQQNTGTLSVSPDTVVSSVSKIGNTEIITATATDDHGTQSECTFMVRFTVGACFQEALYPDVNAVRQCTGNTTAGLSCTSACKSDYIYNNGDSSKIFTCTGSNMWNFSPSDMFCLPYSNPEYIVSLSVVHQLQGLASSCLSSFQQSMVRDTPDFESRISSKCSGMQWRVSNLISKVDTSIQDYLSTFDLSLVSLERNNTERMTCIETIRNNSHIIFALDDKLTCPGGLYGIAVKELTNGVAALTCTSGSYHKTVNAALGTICVPCGSGQYYNSDTTACTGCPTDQFQDIPNQYQCRTCPNGQSPDAYKIECQNTCPAGFTSSNGFWPCTPCPVEQYWTNSKTCTACPAGWTTVGLEGRNDISKCYAPCPAGTYSQTGYNNTECISCPRNFYQDVVGQTRCKECDRSQTTSGSGMTTQAECVDITDVCNSAFCSGHGLCELFFHRRVCTCEPGYTGEDCSNPIHICDNNPCTNDATCVKGATYTEYSCKCRPGVCSMEETGADHRGDSTNYNGSPITSQPDCEQKCLNDVSCLEASYTLIAGSPYCLLYNYTNVPLAAADATSVHMNKSCKEVFGGDDCGKDRVNNCDGSTCHADSMCMDKVNDFKCLCPSLGGYTGTRCDLTADPCSPNPCIGGTCQRFGNIRYECTCSNGYTGQNCDTDIDECVENPGACLYNGTCNNKIDSYSCTCDAGFSGRNCEQVPNFCNGHTCLSNNVCYSSLNDRSGICTCEDPLFMIDLENQYTCKQKSSPCDFRSCENNGTCAETGLQSYCQCSPGWTGSLCQHSFNDCEVNNCQHGVCVDHHLYYNCTCDLGYEGKDCDIDTNDCPGTCNTANSQCSDLVNGYECACKPGYTGRYCDEDINECLSYPCSHDAECTDQVNSYTCSCKPGWTGTNCNERKNNCVTGQCNDGTCYSLVNTSFCRCEGGTQGDNCEDTRDVCKALSGIGLCVNDGACLNERGSTSCRCKSDYNPDKCYFDEGQSGKTGGSSSFYDSIESSSLTAEICRQNCLSDSRCDAVSFYTIPGIIKYCLYYSVVNVTLSPSVNPTDVHFTRTCPTDYSGVSCELVKDWCSVANNPCKNRGMCKPGYTLGFKCECIPGYSGTTCEVENDPCSSNPCRSQATCSHNVTDYICQCDQGKVWTGTQCRDSSQPFVLLVNSLDGQDGPSLQNSFHVDATALSFMVRVRVHQLWTSRDPYLLSIVGSSGLDPNADTTPDFKLEILKAEIKLQYLGKTTILKLDLDNFFGINIFDGEWHHIGWAIAADGSISSTIDATTSSIKPSIEGNFTLNKYMQIKLGYGVIAEYEDLTVWNRHLTSTEFSLAKTGVMPTGSPVQGWWNYKLTPTTTRLAQRLSNSLKQDVTKETPLLNCSVGSVTFVSDTRIVIRDDQHNIAGNLEKIKADNPSLTFQNSLPAALTWGYYSGIVVGTDMNYNHAECRFPVYIKYNDMCPAAVKSNDSGITTAACSSGDGICDISCTDTNQIVSAPLPYYIPCGSLGVYYAENPTRDLVLPSCTLASSPKYVVTSSMEFETVISCKDIVQISENVQEKLDTIFRGLNDKWTEICAGPSSTVCSNLNFLDTNCSSTNARRINIKFALNFNSDKILPKTSTIVDMNVVDALKIIILLEKNLDLSNFGSASLVESSVEVTVQEACPTRGYSILYNKGGALCAPCSRGWYYNVSTDMCTPCPLGMYQDQLAQLECISCPTTTVNRTTYQMAADSVAKCIAVCPAGQYRNESRGTLGTCEVCPRHYYQDMEGQNFCNPCDLTYKTAATGSKSPSDCREACPAGKFRMNDTCINCPRGTYRSLIFDDCQECPQKDGKDRTTMAGDVLAESESACSMDVCNLGEFWNMTALECQKCGLGYYQNVSLMLECTKCGNNRSTKDTGASQISDCIFYCAEGYQIGSRPETCEPCSRGYYKTNESAAMFENCTSCSSTMTTDNIAATTSARCSVPVCEMGQYIEEDGCTDCPQDFYSGVDVPFTATKCVRCVDPCSTCDGRFFGTNVTMATSQSQCYRYCEAGKYLDGNVCKPCARGYYRTNDTDSRFDACIKCGDSNTTDIEGATSADRCTTPICRMGQHIVGGVCTDCPQDSYSGVAVPFTNTKCIHCEDFFGTNVTMATNQSQCYRYCEAGKYLDGNVCKPCKRGYYRTNDTNSRFNACVECGNSKTTDIEGATDANRCTTPVCPPGQYVNITQCVPCDKDTFQDENSPNSTKKCQACPNIGEVVKGTNNTGTANVSGCLPMCLAGQQFNQSTTKCVDCVMGTYKEASDRFGSCMPCPVNYTTNGTATKTSAECNVLDCGPGTYVDGTNCVPCPVGSYQDKRRQTSCILCGEDLSTAETGAESFSVCQISCGPGQIGTDKCALCPEDTVKPNEGYSACSPCTGNYTSNANRTQCSVLYCDGGFKYSEVNGVGICVPCDVGSFKDTRGNDVTCKPCPLRYTTDGPGQQQCDIYMCLAGEHIASGTCEECPIGTFKMTEGNETCTNCTAGLTTEAANSTLESQCNTIVCPAGQYREPSQKKACTSCPVNKYQSRPGETACVQCPVGNITLAVGAISISDCVPKCAEGYRYNSSAKSCDPCPAGFYKNVTGNTADCTACIEGKTTLTSASTKISDCSQTVCQAGTYSIVESGRVVCKNCSLGTYNALKMQTSCKSCGTDRTTQAEGRTSEEDCIAFCPLGQGYSSSEKQCNPCKQNWFNNRQGSRPNTCKQCPNGLTNYQMESSSCPITDDTPATERKVILRFQIYYEIEIDNCNDVSILASIVIKIGDKIKYHLALQTRTHYPQNDKFCIDSNCSNVRVAQTPNGCSSLSRRKRALSHRLLIDVTFNNVSSTVTDTNNSVIDTKDAIAEILDTSKEQLTPVAGIIEYISYTPPTITNVCSAGQRLVNGACVACLAGMYESSGVCVPCGNDKYQNETGAATCKSCPTNTYHDGQSKTSEIECKSWCRTHADYCNSRGTCSDTGARTASCQCFEDYSGSQCTSKDVTTSDTLPVILGAAIGGGGALLIIILVVVGVYKYLSNKDSQSKQTQRSYDDPEYFHGPMYDDGYGRSVGSTLNQPRPLGPYPSVGYPALGYRPEINLDDSAYQDVYKKRPSVAEDGVYDNNPTFVWHA